MTAACPIYGFDVELVPSRGVHPATFEGARREFMTVIVDEAGLEAVEIAGAPWRVTLTRVGSQATEMDREAVADWGRSRQDVLTVVLGPLVELRRRDVGR